MDRIHYYNKNKTGRDFVAGDIHGCFSQLEEELQKVNFDKLEDRLFCVGDLTDKGPESEKAYDYLNYSWFYSVQGNHEKMLIEDTYLHNINGGTWFNSYPLRAEYSTLVAALPILIKVGDNLICHSLIPFSILKFKDLEEQLNNDRSGSLIDYIQWERNPTPIVIKDIASVYAGHTINREVATYGKLINLDTGAFLKNNPEYNFGKLTIRELL